MTTKLLYTIAETSHALGIARTTVYKLIEQEVLTPVKIGRRTLIHIDEIERLARPNGKPGHGNITEASA